MPKVRVEKNSKQTIRDTHFPAGLFGAIFGLILLMSGIHYGLTLLVDVLDITTIGQIMIPVTFLCLVAFTTTMYIRRRMKKTYEEPMKQFAQATAQVARGDFSVYVPLINTPDKMDYLDVMIMDFNKMVEELGSIETLKTDFFSNVSHEIKTPIAVISNEAQLLKSYGELNEQQSEQVEQILRASRRLSNLITNILKLNRLEKQTIQPEAKVYDLCEQICECALMLENRWEEKNIELDIDMEDRVFVCADSSLMEHVWNNLISNAIKFTENKGSIQIQETSTDTEIIVKITDSGCGMSKADIGHIFDKFYQGDSSHATEGNGLGLALVYRVLQLSEGTIHVDSEEGKGSTFMVSMPKAERRDKENGH